jgi:hypothetical protein
VRDVADLAGLTRGRLVHGAGMPFEVTFEPRGVRKRYFGLVTAAEFFESQRVVHEHNEYRRLKYSVHDFLAVEQFTIGVKDVTLFAAHAIGARQTNPRAHLAVVCTHRGIIEFGNLFARLTRLHLEFFARAEDTTAWVEAALEEE